MKYVKFFFWTLPCGIIGLAALGVAGAWLWQIYSSAYATHEVSVQTAAYDDAVSSCQALEVYGDTGPYVPKQNLQEWAARCAAQFGAPDANGVVAGF